MKTLEEIFKGNKGRRVHRHEHVLQIYDEYFSRYRGKDVRVVEIGITEGGSLLMWKEYFGENANIFGIDISTSALEVAGGQIHIYTGDQSDKNFLKSVVDEIKEIDIVIDDGSHNSSDQIVTLESLFPYMRDNGIYAIEDLHTSYREPYGGGYRYDNSIIEYTKNFADYFHLSELPEKAKREVPDYAKEVYAVHFFRNVLLLEKNSMSDMAGSPLLTGKGTIPDKHHDIKGSRFDRR